MEFSLDRHPIHAAITQNVGINKPRYFGLGDPTPHHTDCIGWLFKIFRAIGHDYSWYEHQIPRDYLKTGDFVEILLSLNSKPDRPPLFIHNYSRWGHIGIISDFDQMGYSFTITGEILIEPIAPDKHTLYTLPVK